MKINWFSLVLLTVVAFALRAAQETESREAVLERVAKSSAPAQEFRRLYPDAIIEPWYSYDGSSEYFLKYDQLLLSVGLYQRYVLIMYVAFRRGTTNVEPPKLRITEIDHVDISSNGQANIFYGQGHTYESDKWELLRKAGGDLSALGFSAVTNKPVAGFEREWRKEKWTTSR